uniref:EGF-like domain-containing protein n=1 Tax=Globodera pallida TaxID=36090 RepID=A0A183C216_GLOPA
MSGSYWGRHVGDYWGRHVGDYWGRHVGDYWGRHVGDYWGRHVGDYRERHVGDYWGRHVGDYRERHVGVGDEAQKLRNECVDKRDNDCDRSAKCIDTDDSYICACPQGFLDQSPDPMNRPGRVCVAEINECALGKHRCSPDAICEDTPTGYVCRCKPGFIDLSTNPRHEAGIVCKKLIDECARSELNTCHTDAICVDTHDSYKCICKPGYDDLDEFRNPGRQCVKVQRPSKCQEEGKRQCDKNARCFYDEQNDKLECVCPPNFRDKSPEPIIKPGRVCIPLIPECDNPTLNDCDSPDRAICTDTDEGYMCRCRQGFLDISPNITTKAGRLCKSLENECVKGSHDCARDGGICEDTPDSYTCRCAANFLDVSLDRKNRPGRNCKRLIDECASGQNDCFPGALCADTEDSYTCACPPNHLDVSPDPVKRPGRRCLLRVNECDVVGLSDCSPNASCQDTDEGYNCTCADGFVDESPNRQRRPGRVCRPALVDECQLRKHDCHQEAQCVDLAHGFTCQCRPQFLDESPDRVTHPGRLCVPRPTQAPEECQLGAGAGCNATLHEVCRVIGGVAKCSCPINYERHSVSRACTVIDECQFPQLNDCHPSAECTDAPQGYSCKCRSGFRDVSASKDKPGRVCRAMVNECQFAHLNDCHQNAECVDLEDAYQCRCNAGFKDLRPERPGRLCQQMVNECARPETNSCDKNAKCADEENGYRCECKTGFADVSPTPTLPGRACRPIVNECADAKLNDCDRMAKCVDMEDGYRCECPSNSRDISPSPAFPGRVCHVFENECLTGKHDCDPQALCHDNEQAFTCECPEGFTDRSPNKQHRSGRVCVKLVDECKEGHDTCSANADCRDLEEGYTCECQDGYVDRSPNLAIQPGRICGPSETCPVNHECSAAAVCEPQGGNKYTCTCIQGYVDQSPEGMLGRICVRNSFCRDPKLNNCSRKAVCYEEGEGYRCECARGYVDKSLEGSPKGRVCELPPAPALPQRHPCQEGSHDCHAKASCRAVGAMSFVCECLSGYEDRSPDPKNKGGRVCLLTEPICLDNTRNDCHPAAICAEDAQSPGGGGYTCRCRDGYVDQSPDKTRKAGRICVEYINECLDRSLNDCDPLAVCEDLPDGYTCRCAHNAIDQSPDKRRSGRKCFAQTNECANPSLNNCSRFADCFDKPEGYECRCRAEYHDENPKQPGTSCKFMQNECLNPALNDCSPNAECVDLAGGYMCKCKAPNVDKGPKELPGRICLYNECDDPKLNKCDKNARCEDTEDGYSCRCNDGFYDESASKGQEAGRYCVDYQFGNEAPPVVEQKPHQTSKLPGTACGHNNWCLEERKEVCVGGVRCLCRPGEGRGAPDQKCVPVERTSMAVRVSTQAQKPLFYSSEFGDSSSSSYVELAQEFQRDIGRAVGSTSLAPRYVTSDVSYVTHPKAFNSSWSDGLLVNFTIGTHRGSEPIDRCGLWKQLMSSLHRSNGAIGGGRLNVAPDVDLLDPCAKPVPAGEQCGGAVCNESLGEVCIGGELCGCPMGHKRSGPDDQCRLVESFTIPLWVLRRGVHNLVFNDTFANPIDQLNKEYVRLFDAGVAQCYPHTALRGSFVAAEVNEILDPMVVNASWDMGLLFNATMYFRKGTVRVPADAYNALVRYVFDRNNNELGKSGLFLSPHQQNPFSACFKNNCHPKGICVELGPNAYRCECSAGQRDLNPADPGRKCVPTQGYNECERDEDNECSENARCIDLEFLYKCECLRGYTDAAPKGTVPGSLCMLDYCSDVNYCPGNSTCVNTALQAECHCNNGYTDIRRSESRLSMGLSPDQYCLSIRDVDECALGLHNCSTYATCTNLPDGYTCQCPAGWEDGNPELPGRICASKLCAQCSEHGSCIPDPANSTNVVCQCFDGYSGTFCEVTPSALPLVLAILLAVLFLLLAICSLLFLCTKCRCFKRRRDFSTLDQSASSESGADFTSLYGGIPRAKLKSSSGADSTDVHVARLANYLDDGLRIPRAQLGQDNSSLGSGSSEYTIREEIERRVITDVTRTEEIVTDVDVHESGHSPATAAAAGASSSTARTQFNVFQPGAGTSVNVRSGAGRAEEQERGESVAEFANSRGAWGASANGARAAEHRRHGRNVDERHNGAFAMEERSLGGEFSAEDMNIYDKNTVMSRHHEFHPMDGGVERFSNELSTTKTTKKSREMRK